MEPQSFSNAVLRMSFSVQEIQTSRFSVGGEECQAPIPSSYERWTFVLQQ